MVKSHGILLTSSVLLVASLSGCGFSRNLAQDSPGSKINLIDESAVSAVGQNESAEAFDSTDGDSVAGRSGSDSGNPRRKLQQWAENQPESTPLARTDQETSEPFTEPEVELAEAQDEVPLVDAPAPQTRRRTQASLDSGRNPFEE